MRFRWLRFWWQRRTRGWDDSDLWSLDGKIAEWTLPRLRRFKELNCCHPCDLTATEWDAMLDDMIYALEISAEELTEVVTEADWGRVDRGLHAFGTRFRKLWW